MNFITMPAGQYYIGDLWYVLKKEWNECCELFFAGPTDSGCNEGKFTLGDGRTFINFNTAYGDGTYLSSTGQRYLISVDSGAIGCILVSDLEGGKTIEQLEGDGIVVNFETEFTCDTSNGMMVFGHVRIDTDPSDEVDGFEY